MACRIRSRQPLYFILYTSYFILIPRQDSLAAASAAARAFIGQPGPSRPSRPSGGGGFVLVLGGQTAERRAFGTALTARFGGSVLDLQELMQAAL